MDKDEILAKSREENNNRDFVELEAQLVGVSRNTISSIETRQFNPTAKLALILRVALDQKFEELFYF